MGLLDEPLRGAMGDLRMYQRPGIESARRVMRGELPVPPVWRLFGLAMTDVGLGTATLSMPVTRWFEDAFGLVWGGTFALVADGALAGALWTCLPSGQGVTTSELNLSFVRPITRETHNLVGRARAVHLGRQVGLSTVEISDGRGRMLAHGTTRCIFVDVPVDPDADLPTPDTGPDDPPDPWRRRPPEGGRLDLASIQTGEPMELLTRVAANEVVANIQRLLNGKWTTHEPGRISAAFPTSPWFSAGGPNLYGGVIAWMVEAVTGTAVYSTLGAGELFATLDMNVRFARPALVGQGPLTIAAEVRHLGRRLRITSAELTSGQGKRIAIATSSALVVPDGVQAILQGRTPEEVLETD